jgi:uncharacterized RDD family membrane protein YckC
LSRTITVVTPENIQVTYQVAGFASRFMATLIDLCLQLLAILLVGMILRLVAGTGAHKGIGLASLITAVGIIVVYLVLLAYAIFFEMLWGGRTPGKRLFGLRVIREGGYPINLTASVIRNALRFVDIGLLPLPGNTGLALFGLPGLLCIFFSPSYKRIGDYAAGTLVIVEAGASPFGISRGATAASRSVVAFMPMVRNLDRLTVEEYRVIRRFVARREELDIAVQAAIGERLARPLMQKLELDVPVHFQVQYADLLEAIERRYAEERGVL